MKNKTDKKDTDKTKSEEHNKNRKQSKERSDTGETNGSSNSSSDNQEKKNIAKKHEIVDVTSADGEQEIVLARGEETEADQAQVAAYLSDDELSDDREEVTETDPSYQLKRRKKIILGAVGALIAVAILLFAYHRVTTVTTPDFKGKPLSEAREWATDHKIKLEVDQAYDFDTEVNHIIKQKAQVGKRVKKKNKFLVVSSLGPDPEDHIKLPDFSSMDQGQAEKWVEENKAENVTITSEYDDKIEKSKFIKQQFSDKEMTAEKYKRKDQLVVAYSKGKEVFEKNINVPNFVKKAKAEVETWAKKNDIAMTYEETDSDTIEQGFVIKQSVAENEKVAKKDAMTVTISKGKAFVVPNFAEYNKNSAAEYQHLTVNVKEQFSDGVAFGQLISQSVEPGKKIFEADKAQPITVIYSSGRPYLKSYIGLIEGDLPELFFNDYQSKGANISYVIYYVDSEELKGTVVDMSNYNEYVPLNYTVNIAVSNGIYANSLPRTNEVEEEAAE
ncbi:PASTA domain-containing protein [Vagococcus elongatus]